MTKTYGEKKIKLGDKIECTVTGFKGTATGYSIFLNGCEQLLIAPVVNEKGEKQEAEWFDTCQIMKIKAEKPIEIKQKKVGGPSSTDSRRAY